MRAITRYGYAYKCMRSRTCQAVISLHAPLVPGRLFVEEGIDFRPIFSSHTFVCHVRCEAEFTNHLLTEMCVHQTFSLIGWTVVTYCCARYNVNLDERATDGLNWKQRPINRS